MRVVEIAIGTEVPTGRGRSDPSRPTAMAGRIALGPAVTLPSGSGEVQEQLLHPLQVHRLVLAVLRCGDALLQPTRDNLEAGPVERPGHGGKLGDHVGAVAAGLQHRDDATDLALGPAESLDHITGRVLVDPHRWLLVVARRTDSTPRGIAGQVVDA